MHDNTEQYTPLEIILISLVAISRAKDKYVYWLKKSCKQGKLSEADWAKRKREFILMIDLSVAELEKVRKHNETLSAKLYQEYACKLIEEIKIYIENESPKITYLSVVQ